MTGAAKLKNYSHIWDNVMTSTQPTHHHHEHHHHQLHAGAYQDSTGSSVSIIEYSRSEITVAAPIYSKPKACQPPVKKYPVYQPLPPKITTKKPKCSGSGNPGFCTNRDRELAEHPIPANTWKFQKDRRQKYDSASVTNAFSEYSHRLSTKKMRLEQEKMQAEQQKSKKKVTVKGCKVENCKEEKTLYSNNVKIEMQNRRDDEIRIDAIQTKKMVALSCDDVEQSGKCSGFYGTIEAELSADQAALYLMNANEHLERLQFVAGAVFPEVENHLKKLEEMASDVKDFSMQQRQNRIKPPSSVNCSQAAHFVIAENGFE